MTNDTNKRALNILLKVGFAEGVSFLVLLLIAMPLKYIAHMPTPVRVVGMLHGVLFIWYAIALLRAKMAYGWSLKKAFVGFLLSFLPFGTFYLDRILKKQN
jgi:integral membrane protein